MKLTTYKTNVSLYVGDQLLFFDLVEFLRRFPLRLGPTMFTSTKGRNIPKNIGRTTIYFFCLQCRYHTIFIAWRDCMTRITQSSIGKKIECKLHINQFYKDCMTCKTKGMSVIMSGGTPREVLWKVHLYSGEMCFLRDSVLSWG